MSRAFAFRSQDCYRAASNAQIAAIFGGKVKKADLLRIDGEAGAEASAGVRVDGLGGRVGRGDICVGLWWSIWSLRTSLGLSPLVFSLRSAEE